MAANDLGEQGERRRQARSENLWQLPGRLLEMRTVGVIEDLLRFYEAEPTFIDELRRAYTRNRHVLSLAICLANAYQQDFKTWYEARLATRYPAIAFGAGSYRFIESWHALKELARRSEPSPPHLGSYIENVETIAARWMVGAPWGPEIMHSLLVTWRSNPAWRGTRLSVGGGEGPGLPSLWLNVRVQFDPDGNTWGEVKQWVLRDAKRQFDELMARVSERERRAGRPERITPPHPRRRTPGAEPTPLRNLRWLFKSLAPQLPHGRPLTAHEIYTAEPGDELALSAVEKALSGLRGELDL